MLVSYQFMGTGEQLFRPSDDIVDNFGCALFPADKPGSLSGQETAP